MKADPNRAKALSQEETLPGRAAGQTFRRAHASKKSRPGIAQFALDFQSLTPKIFPSRIRRGEMLLISGPTAPHCAEDIASSCGTSRNAHSPPVCKGLEQHQEDVGRGHKA